MKFTSHLRNVRLKVMQQLKYFYLNFLYCQKKKQYDYSIHCLEILFYRRGNTYCKNLRVFFYLSRTCFSTIVFNFFFLGIHSVHKLFCFLYKKCSSKPKITCDNDLWADYCLTRTHPIAWPAGIELTPPKLGRGISHFSLWLTYKAKALFWHSESLSTHDEDCFNVVDFIEFHLDLR